MILGVHGFVLRVFVLHRMGRLNSSHSCGLSPDDDNRLSATERSGDICVFGVYLLCVLEALGEPLVPRRELESNQAEGVPGKGAWVDETGGLGPG